MDEAKTSQESRLKIVMDDNDIKDAVLLWCSSRGLTGRLDRIHWEGSQVAGGTSAVRFELTIALAKGARR